MFKIAVFAFFLACSQYAIAQTMSKANDTLKQPASDSLKVAYVNKGKIAARRAAIQSMILPGLGQINNKVTFWSIGKVGLIYGGFTALTLSYIDNSRYYHVFLDELTYRQTHNDQPSPGSIYSSYTTKGLYTAKDVYRRNRELIIFSYVGVYAINVIDAYVAARLKYFNVTDDIAFQIKPDISPVYANNGMILTTGLKLSLKL